MVRTVTAQVVSNRTGWHFIPKLDHNIGYKAKGHSTYSERSFITNKWFLVTGMEMLRVFLNILESFFLVGDKVPQLWLTFVIGEPGKNWLASGRLQVLTMLLKSAHHFLSYVQSPFTQMPNFGKMRSNLTSPSVSSHIFSSHFYQFYPINVFLFLQR